MLPVYPKTVLGGFGLLVGLWTGECFATGCIDACNTDLAPIGAQWFAATAVASSSAVTNGSVHFAMQTVTETTVGADISVTHEDMRVQRILNDIPSPPTRG
jgi:hypothetical protein